MAKKKFSSVWIVEQYKTVLPDGLTISRNHLKFTIKWKIKDSYSAAVNCQIVFCDCLSVIVSYIAN